jgi:hypothetical protein
MAVYRIFPEKDTFIFSEPTIAGTYGNAGKDEILEIGGYPDANLDARSNRTLIQFSTDDILSTLNSKVDSSWTANLHLSLAEAGELPQSYTLYAYPISQSWTNGTGKRDDRPVNITGVTWKHLDSQTTEWSNLGADFITSSVSGSQTHGISSNHDVDIDITSIVDQHYSGSLNNNGILVKLDDTLEQETTSSINLKYFSSDTHTIYPPYLEFRWDDSTYSTNLSELSTDIATITIKNHKEKYTDSDKVRFRLSARPKYPTRTFTTSSIYLQEYALPQESYWGIKDEFTEEMVIDFNNDYTKVSADNTGCFFDVYMDTLQPERFYRLLVKTALDSNTVVIDNKNIFKVTRHG